MTKKTKKLAILLVALMTSVTIFIACNNENDTDSDIQLKSTGNNTIFNPDNTYDVYGEGIIKLCKKINQLLLDEKLNEDDYYTKVEMLIKSNLTSYPKYSEKDILSLDSIRFYYMLDTFVDELTRYGVIKASRKAENYIKKNFTNLDEQKICLCIISELKYYLYASSTINYAPDREQRLDNCMYNKMYDIKHGNWIDKVVFIAGLPESAIVLFASCEYDAAFNPNKQECQMKKPFPKN